MAENDRSSFSRRRWLELVSLPALTTTVGAALLNENAFAGEPSGIPDDKNLGARVYNIREFGAVGDGKTVDTAAVQSAIDACHNAEGGTVLVPAGVFVIGTIEMKSNVTLHIAAAGKLLGSADGKQYHAAHAIPLEGDATLRDGHVGLIFAVKADNITIEGPGTIDGQGAQFHSPRRGVPPPSGRGGSKRPYHLLFYQCKNLRVRDLFLFDSAFHSVRVIESQFVWLTGLHIYNRVNGNNDGFHFISSEYVHVANCDVQSQDDACALFGSCRFVTITNSTFSTRWAVFRFGGGNPENVTISNCVIYDTYGCPIKMQFDGDSRAQNLLFSNLILQDVTGPISIDVNSRRHRSAAPNEPLPTGFVRNISFSNIRGRVVSQPRPIPDIPVAQSHRPGEYRQCVVLNCIGDGFIEGVTFDNVHLTYGGGGTASDAQRKIPEVAGEYFEIGTPPAYGLYGRNVRGLTLNNVRFGVNKPDLRPAIMLDHAADIAINGLSADGHPQAAVLHFIAVQDALLTATRVVKPAAIVLRVEGATSSGIIVDGGDLSKAPKPLALESGALSEAVKLRV